MAASIEMATAYVTLAVETSGLSQSIKKAFSGIDSIALSAGESIGKNLSKGAAKVDTSGIDALRAALADAEDKSARAAAKIEANEKKLSAAIEQGARKQANARAHVEIAEKRLAEIREKAGAKESQILAAKAGLARAEQKLSDEAYKAKAAQEAFGQALEASKASFQKAEAGVKEAASELASFEAKAKAAADEAEKTGSRFASAFSGIKEKIRASFRGAFDSAKSEARSASGVIEDEFSDAGKKSGGAFKESFKGAFAGLAAYVGVSEVIGGFTSSIMAAGNLQQSMGAIDTAFGESSGIMKSWAETASSSLGISANSYNEFATLIGSQLKNAGVPLEELGGKTNELISLGADMASMFGGTTAEAVEALSAMMKGETDPIEKYGVSISEAAMNAKALELGIQKTGGSFSEQEKYLIRMALLYEQTADAQGNFAKESDTFQGQLQRAGAEWQNLSAKIGGLFIPIATSAFSIIRESFLPTIDGFVTGLGAFGEGWANADGIISGSGFLGVMEALGEAGSGLTGWLSETSGLWGPFAAGVGIVTAAYWGWTGATTALTLAKVGLANALKLVNWPITLIITGLGLLVGGLIHAYNNVEWFKTAVDGAWAGIQQAIAFVVDWWISTAWPALSSGLSEIGAVITWLWQNVAVPAFAAIGEVIRSAWEGYIQPALSAVYILIRDQVAPIFLWLWAEIISPAFTGIQEAVRLATEYVIIPLLKLAWAFIRDILGPVFLWLWREIITPAWDGIALAVKIAWKLIEINLGLFNGFLRNILGPAIRWLWENVVKPSWEAISAKIGEVTNWVVDNLFPKFKGGLDALKRGFELTREGISTAWQKLKKAVGEPVKFVVNTVINDGLIAGYNKLSKFWDGTPLDRIELPAGFATGGWTGPGGKYQVAGLVHADEFVIQKSSRRRFEQENPGLLAYINQFGKLPSGAAAGGLAGHNHGPGRYCKHCAAAGVSHSTSASTAGAPPSGRSGIWGPFQQQIAAAGKVYVPKINFMGVDTSRVAQAWMGRSAIQVISGSGSPGVNFLVGGAGTWGFNAGSNIWMQPSVPQAMREAVLIHELGHALSLHHTMNTGSIMHPLVAGPKWPSALDSGALAAAWGKAGEGVKTYESGDSLLSMLVEKARDLITDRITSLASAARIAFKGNRFVDLPIGMAEAAGKGLVSSIASKLGASSSSSGAAAGGSLLGRATLYDRGGKIDRGLQIIDHQRATPDYVLTDQQWETMYRLARTAGAAAGSPAPAGLTVNVGEMHGGGPEDLALQLDKIARQRRLLSL